MAGQVTKPVFRRNPKGRVLGGVASGLAIHLKVDVIIVRLVLVGLCFLASMGGVFYAIAWLVTDMADSATAENPPRKENLPEKIDWILVALAIVGSFMSGLAINGFKGSTVSLVVVVVGALIAWRAYDKGIESLNIKGALLPAAFGGVLVIIGVLLITLNWENEQVFGATALAVVLTLVGVTILGVPLWLRLWEQLMKQKALAIAAKEKADIASRLHDSVLQTLALIQKKAGDNTEVAKLARTQERQLRDWLFGNHDSLSGGAATAFAALKLACAEVEDTFGTTMNPVTVGGDVPLTDATQAVILAAREAMVNSAKHSGCRTTDVYAEILGNRFTVFVRDRGVGFDPQDIRPGHNGLAESVTGRMERAGGEATITSSPGQGTEVEVAIDLPQ